MQQKLTTRQARALAAIQAGFTPAEAGKRFGVGRTAIYNRLARVKARGIHIPQTRQPRVMVRTLSLSCLDNV